MLQLGGGGSRYLLFQRTSPVKLCFEFEFENLGFEFAALPKNEFENLKAIFTSYWKVNSFNNNCEKGQRRFLGG